MSDLRRKDFEVLLREWLSKWDGNYIDSPGDSEVWGKGGLVESTRAALEGPPHNPPHDARDCPECDHWIALRDGSFVPRAGAAALDVAALDLLVSAIHDRIYAEPFDRKAASDAVWAVHEVLRSAPEMSR